MRLFYFGTAEPGGEFPIHSIGTEPHQGDIDCSGKGGVECTQGDGKVAPKANPAQIHSARCIVGGSKTPIVGDRTRVGREDHVRIQIERPVGKEALGFQPDRVSRANKSGSTGHFLSFHQLIGVRALFVQGTDRGRNAQFATIGQLHAILSDPVHANV